MVMVASEPETAKTDLCQDVERVGRLAARGAVELTQAIEHRSRGRLPRRRDVADRARNRVLPRGRRIGQQLQQVGEREILAQLVGRDNERIERAGRVVAAAEREHFEPVAERRDVLPAVVGLRIEIENLAPSRDHS